MQPQPRRKLTQLARHYRASRKYVIKEGKKNVAADPYFYGDKDGDIWVMNNYINKDYVKIYLHIMNLFVKNSKNVNFILT